MTGEFLNLDDVSCHRCPNYQSTVNPKQQYENFDHGPLPSQPSFGNRLLTLYFVMRFLHQHVHHQNPSSPSRGLRKRLPTTIMSYGHTTWISNKSSKMNLEQYPTRVMNSGLHKWFDLSSIYHQIMQS